MMKFIGLATCMAAAAISLNATWAASMSNMQSLRNSLAPAIQNAKCTKDCIAWQKNNYQDPSKNFHGVKKNGQLQLVPTQHCVAWTMTCNGR